MPTTKIINGTDLKPGHIIIGQLWKDDNRVVIFTLSYLVKTRLKDGNAKTLAGSKVDFDHGNPTYNEFDFEGIIFETHRYSHYLVATDCENNDNVLIVEVPDNA